MKNSFLAALCALALLVVPLAQAEGHNFNDSGAPTQSPPGKMLVMKNLQPQSAPVNILENVTATQLDQLIEATMVSVWHPFAQRTLQSGAPNLLPGERARYAQQLLTLFGAIVYHKDANGHFERLMVPSTGSISPARGSVRMSGIPGTQVPRAVLFAFSPVTNALDFWWMDADATIGSDGTVDVPITYSKNNTPGVLGEGVLMIPIPAVTGLDALATVLAPGIRLPSA